MTKQKSLKNLARSIIRTQTEISTILPDLTSLPPVIKLAPIEFTRLSTLLETLVSDYSLLRARLGILASSPTGLSVSELPETLSLFLESDTTILAALPISAALRSLRLSATNVDLTHMLDKILSVCDRFSLPEPGRAIGCFVPVVAIGATTAAILILGAQHSQTVQAHATQPAIHNADGSISIIPYDNTGQPIHNQNGSVTIVPWGDRGK